MMVKFKCPKCKRVRWGDIALVMKICSCCQIEMEVVE